MVKPKAGNKGKQENKMNPFKGQGQKKANGAKSQAPRRSNPK